MTKSSATPRIRADPAAERGLRSRLAFATLAVALTAALFAITLAPGAEAKAHSCFGKPATITSSAKRILGTKGHDTIVVLGGGRHVVDGRGGNDRICAGPGNDTLRGGRGIDKIAGGGGNDRIFGGKGPDRLEGGRGHDLIDGEQGSDRIVGGPGDDRLHGDKGNDTVLGGAGADRIDGGPGDDPRLAGGRGTDQVFGGPGSDRATGGPGDGDVVRGDGGSDRLDGGPGLRDIASYASAARGGVTVNLAAGVASGDGQDRLRGFEDAVGSPQGDRIVGNRALNRLDGGVGDDNLDGGGGGASEAYGGPGSDRCDGFALEDSCGPEAGPPPGAVAVTMSRGLDGASLVVQGSDGADDLRLALAPEGWTVSADRPIFAGDGCTASPGLALCAGEPALSLVVITGGPGEDRIAVDPSVPAWVTVRANGNGGSDTLTGGAGNDVLEAGENYKGPDRGNDTLVGNGGSDVLYADPGADRLFGGPGNDLLVSSVLTCQGHHYDGGPGVDTVSYARSEDRLRIALGGSGGPVGCGSPDQVLGSNESLEGSDGPDVLIGDNGPNSLMGHGGADVLLGRGGPDYLDAVDGGRDARIDCGGGGDYAMRDPADPRPISC
jgi:Ca2+-binding RTX toxin-like protein